MQKCKFYKIPHLKKQECAKLAKKGLMCGLISMLISIGLYFFFQKIVSENIQKVIFLNILLNFLHL